MHNLPPYEKSQNKKEMIASAITLVISIILASLLYSNINYNKAKAAQLITDKTEKIEKAVDYNDISKADPNIKFVLPANQIKEDIQVKDQSIVNVFGVLEFSDEFKFELKNPTVQKILELSGKINEVNRHSIFFISIGENKFAIIQRNLGGQSRELEKICKDFKDLPCIFKQVGSIEGDTERILGQVSISGKKPNTSELYEQIKQTFGDESIIHPYSTENGENLVVSVPGKQQQQKPSLKDRIWEKFKILS